MGGTPEGAVDREDPLAAATRWLDRLESSRRLDRAELRRDYGRHDFSVGWRLPVRFGDEVRQLDVLLPTAFPSALSRIALVDRPAFGTWPHIEEDGLLCLPARLPNDATAVDDVQVALADAAVLIEDSRAGRNEDDLREEFQSYWSPTVTGNRQVLTVFRPEGPSRSLSVWRGKELDVVADSETVLRRWLNFKNGTTDTRRWSSEQGLLLWLRQPLLPATYPKSAADVLCIAEAAGAADALVALSADVACEAMLVVIGAPTRHGAVMAGVGLRKPPIVKNGNGFRRVPPQIHVSRYFAPSIVVQRIGVERADPEWIHGRGQDARQPRLRQASVVVIGGGSVGAPVTLTLAQAGVGRIDVIDPQHLLWANIGRHPLGAEYVGRNKAEALADRIRRSFPHIEHAAGHARLWEDVARTTPAVLLSADVIVSALGDWASESALNKWHLQHEQRRPIVYAWTEAHACAGHAVAVMATGGCFRCGFSENGRPHLRVAEWPEQTTQRQEPGCGALFQPYGPVELQHTVAVAGELILDVLLGAVETSAQKVWAASEDFVNRTGGRWTAEWKQRSRSKGAVVEVLDWPPCPLCPECGHQIV